MRAKDKGNRFETVKNLLFYCIVGAVGLVYLFGFDFFDWFYSIFRWFFLESGYLVLS